MVGEGGSIYCRCENQNKWTDGRDVGERQSVSDIERRSSRELAYFSNKCRRTQSHVTSVLGNKASAQTGTRQMALLSH